MGNSASTREFYRKDWRHVEIDGGWSFGKVIWTGVLRPRYLEELEEPGRRERNYKMAFSARKILLAGEGSEDAALAAKAAIDIAIRTGSELHVVHAWHSVPSTRFEYYIRAQLKQEAQESLDEQVERIKGDGADVTEAYLREGPTVDEILDLAEEIDAGLVVMGSRGLGAVKRLVIGSVSEGVVQHFSDCEELLVARDQLPVSSDP